MKKITLIIAIIIIAVLAYCFYQSRLTPEEESKGEETKDEITLFLEKLKQETGIDFSEIKEAEFKWIVKVDSETTEETVAGKEFEAEKISSEQYDSIYPFFMDNGFKTDVYNMAAGTISGLAGYKKDEAVCTVAGGLTGYKEAEDQWIPTDTNHWDISVECGKLEEAK